MNVRYNPTVLIPATPNPLPAHTGQPEKNLMISTVLFNRESTQCLERSAGHTVGPRAAFKNDLTLFKDAHLLFS